MGEKPRKKNPSRKPHFAFDENQQFKKLKKEFSGKAQFISVISVMGERQKKDPEIISECNKQDLHIITHNTKDFMNPPSSIKIGIVGVNLENEDAFIPKFNRMLKKMYKHEDYSSKTIVISNIITVLNRVNGDIRII